MTYPSVNEAIRLQALHELKILDTPGEPAFERLSQAARDMFDVPYALITFLDADRAYIKAGWGIDFCEAEREHAICNYTILHDTVFVVPDTHSSDEFRNNPYVRGEPYIRFYAGAPLTIAPGVRVGTICLIDTKPRVLNAKQVRDLIGLAQVTVGELWLRRALRSEGQALHPLRTSSTESLNFSADVCVSGPQTRAARALLGWTILDLAKAAEVSVNTVKRLEAATSQETQRPTCNLRIRATLERAGVFFLDNSGVSLRHQ